MKPDPLVAALAAAVDAAKAAAPGAEVSVVVSQENAAGAFELRAATTIAHGPAGRAHMRAGANCLVDPRGPEFTVPGRSAGTVH